MRIFSNLLEAHGEIQRDLFEVGEWIRGSTYQDKLVEEDSKFDFMELSPYVYSLTGTDDLGAYIEKLNLNEDWIRAEFDERIGLDFSKPANPGSAWKFRKDVWEEFLEEDGKFAYTYAERFCPDPNLHQTTRVLTELKIRPASRQCIVGIFDATQDLLNLGGHHRIPCSMFYQLMVRNEAVDLHYVMRSCDFFTHFPYDQILALTLQAYTAHLLGREIGIFHHIITSLHGFRKDFPEGVF